MKKIINYKLQKILLFSFLFLICFNYLSFVNAKTYKIGTTLEKNFKFSKKFILPLSEGKWEVVDRFIASYAFLYAKETWIVRLENNEIMEMILVSKLILSGTNMGEIDSVVNQVVFKDKYDGCYERPEYFIVEVYKRGGTHNCLLIAHMEVNKEIYTPDDPSDNGSSAMFKKWIRDNSIIIPPIAFASKHSYFSRLSRGDFYVITYVANPKIYNSPKINYITEESSEFHKSNISRYPDHKITMDKWVSVSAKRHQFLEEMFKAKEHHLLNLNKYIIQSDEIDENKNGQQNLNESLKQLNELYKSGVITKEEFKKAKDNILN